MKGLLYKKHIQYLIMIIVIMGVVLSCIPFFSYHALAEENNRKVIKVGYYIAPGFQDYDEDSGEYSGSSYEYLMAVRQYTNWDFKFVPVNFSEGVQMLSEGKIDLMNNVSKTPEREQLLSFSSYASGSNYGCIIVDADDNEYAYNDFASFDTLKVGMLKTSIFRSYFESFCEEHGINPKISYFDTDDDMTNAVENGTINARIVSSSYRDGSRVIAKFAPMDYYFAVPKGEDAIMQELNDAMMHIKTDMPDFISNLDEKYSDNYTEKKLVLSEEEKQFIKDNPVIKVAVSNVWYPISYFSEDGTYEGPLAKIYSKISEATGLKFEFVKYDEYSQALDAVSNGKTDMIAEFPYDFIFAQKWNVQLSDLVNDVSVYKVIDEDSNNNINTIALSGQTYIESQVRKIYGDNVKYISYDSVDEAVDAVLSGKADATFINYYRATSYQNKGKYITLKYIFIPSLDYKFGLGLSADNKPILKSIIGKGLQTIDGDYIDLVFQESIQDDKMPDIEAQFYKNPRLFLFFIAVMVAVVVLLIASVFYTRRMKRKNSELSRAKKAQSDFLSRMSHDMRTPMNGILGLSYLMEKEKNIDIIKGYIPQLQESSSYLLQLINDVLDVNKIESGNLTLNPKVCDEEKVFDSIMDLMKPLIDEKHIQFNFKRINIEWQYMILDEQRVKQIFINLLNNAVKFTPDGGKIDFVMELVSQTDTMIRDKFIVRDNGIGISNDFLPHIFEPFKQEEALQMDYTRGTGLGLPIVKQLVELMGGTIQVESEKNKGTQITVYVNFPLAKKPENEMVSDEKKIERYEFPRKLNILLLEDNSLNATIAMKLLEKQNAVVTWAENGKEGTEIFEKSEIGEFDVILMDIRMPIMNGLEAAEYIRNIDREDAKSIPIIAMSANAYEEDIKNSIDAGMNAHLAKPIDPYRMFDEISKFI